MASNDDSPTEAFEFERKDENLQNSFVATRTKVVARRYELWHEKFLSYQEILDYLIKLQGMYRHKVVIERLGVSKEGRPICLVKIASGRFGRPSMSVMIEAGSNGSELMTISSALYLIDYLTKNNLVLLVEYLIIPCLNPDAYEKCLEFGKAPNKNVSAVDLSKCFPKNFKTSGQSQKEYFRILTQIATLLPKSLYTFEVHPNCLILMAAIEKYKTRIKLFISLQASESSLTYSLDYYLKEVYQFALACKKSMEWDKLDVKPIIPNMTEKNGTVIEYVIRNFGNCIRFGYILNVHNESFLPDEKFILSKGEQTFYGISTLTKRVYKYYTKQRVKYNVTSVVKML